MEHSFDIDIAKIYGIPSAILLKNLYFWIEKNRANEKNYYDGYYWTYNSKKAFSELFPYMTARQIDYALQKMIDDGLIITGNYNKVAYDRTLWYAITKKGYSILQNCKMEVTKTDNGINGNVTPIPNNKPNDFPNEKQINKERKKETEKTNDNSFDSLIEKYSKGDDEVKKLLCEWLKVRKAKRAAMTDYAVELNLKKLEDLSEKSNLTVTEYLEEIIRKGWQAFYKINDYSNTQYNRQQQQQQKKSETDDFMEKLKSMYHEN